MNPKDLNFYRPQRALFPLGWCLGRWYYVGAAAFLFVFLFLVQFNYSNEVTIVGESGAVELMMLAPQFTMAEKIKEGIELLSSSTPLKYETRNGRSSGELARKQIALAVLDKATGDIFEHRAWVKENEIKNYRQTGVIKLESTSDLKIAVAWWNSFNTDYTFPDNPNLVIVANKYLWPSSNLGTLPERSKNKYTEIIYVPFSAGLHTPEIVEAGKKYIEENIDTAFGQLESAGVMSRFASGQMVTADIKKEFIKNIILVEHIDPDAFRTADDGGRMLAERVLVLIGANKNKAYRYTASPAGASGLAQFIRPTYQNIYSKYPKARLVKDHTLGMANHVNAIKAMVLFFDEHKKALANRITRKDMVKPLGITEEMLAAAYNGGPSRVARSINKFGPAWIGNQLLLPSSQKTLRLETLNYIEKFRSIKNLDVF